MPHFRKRDLLPPTLAQEESRRILARRGITTRYKVDAAYIPLYRECWADPAIRALVPLDFKQQVRDPRTQAKPEHWWTPPAYRAGRADLAAVTREHGLEGVVAKRVSARYLEGRRAPGAWRKLKHRHLETLIVTAWERGVGRGDELLVSRRDRDTGELRHAGRVPLRLSPGQRAAVQNALAAIEPSRGARGRVRLLEPVLAVDVAHHGRGDGAIRDPILKTFRPAC